MSLKKVSIEDLSFNPFKAIGNDWMLITAGDEKKCNTMTASWGGVGVLWNKPIAICFIRPQRYTFEFVENNDYFSLSFLPNDMRDTLTFCGRTSGRDVDKIKKTGLKTAFDLEAPYFEQSNTVLICKKLYAQTIKPELFLEKEIEKSVYPAKDYHKTYVGEIVKVLKNNG